VTEAKKSAAAGSLADLLLGDHARRARTAAHTSPAGGQLDLLFAQPAPVQEPPVQRSRIPPSESRSATPPAEVLWAAQPIADRKVWNVRELVAGVRNRLEREYDNVWVEGEISNCRPAASGHIYFTLKEGDAQLAVVMFRAQASLLRFRPRDGLAVLARGRVSVYDQRGQLQLIAETMEPRGAGALQLAYEELKARLLAEGLFDSARKRPLPPFPRCVGVVTSTSGAVLHDIVKVVRRRHARLQLLVYPAVVQGAGCAASVSAGIRWFNANPERVELILIARGGGSMEDLAGFNDEALARTIAASALPVVSAVGHETDFTIADFVADLRAPTPSAAAEIITAAQHRVEERVAELDARMRRAIRYHLMLARQRYSVLAADQVLVRAHDAMGRPWQRLDELERRLESCLTRRLEALHTRLGVLTSAAERANPAVRLAIVRRRLETAGQSLERLAASAITSRTGRLERASGRLAALSPLAVLSRGYALVYGADGALLRDAAQAKPGERIHARFAAGSLDAEVLKSGE